MAPTNQDDADRLNEELGYKDEQEQLLKEHLEKNNIYTKRFAATIAFFGTSMLEQLLRNAFLLSMVHEYCWCKDNNEPFSCDEVHDRHGINRYLSFIVKKEHNEKKNIDYYVIPDYKNFSDFEKIVRNRHGLSEDNYNAFFHDVKKACKNKLDVCQSHPHITAVRYLYFLFHLIRWAGTGADRHLNKEDLNRLLLETKDRVGKILELVTLPPREGTFSDKVEHFAMRHFWTCTKYFKGAFVERLNQLLTKYREKLAKNQPAHLKNHTYVLGIPKRKNISKKATKDQVFELPNYDAYNGDDYDVERGGALAEKMIRRNWEIARIASQGQNILTTYSHKDGLPKKEETVPTLTERVNRVDHIIHQHYSGDWANKRWLLESLQHEIDQAQVQEFICDYGYYTLTDKQIDGESKIPEIKDNPPFVLSKYSKIFFDETIPNLAKMHFLAKDGIVLVPFCAWTVYNLYRCKDKYQGTYKIQFLNSYKTIDDAHDVWRKKIDVKDSKYMSHPNPKPNLKYQKEHMVEELGEKLKETIFKNMTSSKDLTPEIKQEYAEHWLSVPEDKFNKFRWIQFTNCQDDENERDKPCIRPYNVDGHCELFMRNLTLKKDDFGGFLILGSPPFATQERYNDNDGENTFTLEESNHNPVDANKILKLDEQNYRNKAEQLKTHYRSEKRFASDALRCWSMATVVKRNVKPSPSVDPSVQPSVRTYSPSVRICSFKDMQCWGTVYGRPHLSLSIDNTQGVVPLVSHHSADWNNTSFLMKMIKENNHIPYEMIIADHDFFQENKGNDNVDKGCFRKEFFQKFLPKVACHGLVKTKVILPFRPWILFQLVLNKKTINDHYVLKFTKEDVFMVASIDEFKTVASKMDLLSGMYHGTDNPMRVREVVNRMKSFSCDEKKDHGKAQKNITNMEERVTWDQHLMAELGNIITDFHPENMSDIKYKWVELTPRDPNNPNETDENVTKEAEDKISCRVKQASESSVLLNKASAKKNGMWLQLAKVGGVEVPRIHFDVGVHEDLKRWIENNQNSSNPTNELQVCVCDGKNELLHLTSRQIVGASTPAASSQQAEPVTLSEQRNKSHGSQGSSDSDSNPKMANPKNLFDNGSGSDDGFGSGDADDQTQQGKKRPRCEGQTTDEEKQGASTHSRRKRNRVPPNFLTPDA